MSRPLSRGPQFDDDAEADAAVDRTDHIDRGRPTERIDLDQMEALPGATEAIAMPPGGEGWGYLPPSTSTPQLAASPDQRSQYTQVLQPMPAAPQTMAVETQPVYPAEPVQPGYVTPEPARRTVSQVPVQGTWSEPEPEPPVQLPRPPERRRTAALPVGTIMVLVACGALGWGTYTLLSTLHVFEILSTRSWTPNWAAIGAAGGGAVLAFFAFLVSCSALARAKPKGPAVLLVLAALFLPLVATGAGVYYGAGVLKTHTLAEAESFSGQLKIGNVDQALKALQSGVSFPGRDDLISILNTVKDKAAEQGVAPSDTDSQGADQSGDQQDGSQDGGSQDGGGQDGGDGQQGEGDSDGGQG